MPSIQITSANYNGQTANVTFYSSNNPTVGINLGSQTIPYIRDSIDVYGTYELYFISYNKTCSITINDPTITPTPTTTSTVTPTQTVTPTATPTPTLTRTPTNTPTSTPTSSAIPPTPTPTITITPTSSSIPATPTPTPTPVSVSFNYVYKILNLTYITNIEYSIYGLDYDGGGGVVPSVLNNNGYIYENDSLYNWN